ncbi:MAG: hypothetical protein LDL33_00240 [Desulfomonile sp.]|nr:hypothetical protein [Desulfomonile sp.]
MNLSSRYFIVTIDTEGDNIWSKPRKITCRNARFLPRFQALCESYHLKPVYLTTYEMATDPFFQDFGRDIVARNAAEIGMHLHAWNTPPQHRLTDDDYGNQPYLTEYPVEVMREKVEFLTQLLRETFQADVISHRGGRWAFNEVYASILIENGYSVDCSVTPHISWKAHLGAPDGSGGPDYTGFPYRSYFLDPHDISRPGLSKLLEVPVTVLPERRTALHRLVETLNPRNTLRRVVNLLQPPFRMLSLRRGRLSSLKAIVERCLAEDREYVEFMTHSSQLMPGGSPAFPTERDVKRVYDVMEELFAFVTSSFTGCTLAEYAEIMRSRA